MFSIYLRELRSYLCSPIGYVFIGMFLLISNLFFYLNNVLMASSNIVPLFMNMMMILMLLIPLLTMRLFSEEFKQKTDQMILTAPLKLSGIVLGKFFAALSVFLIALAFTLLWIVVVTVYGTVPVYSVVGNYVAIILVASMFISIGLFVSALTENQLIAAVLSFAIFFGLYLLDYAISAIDIQAVKQVISWLSVFVRFTGFTRGIFYISDAVFYLCLTAAFLFMSVRVLQRKQWA